MFVKIPVSIEILENNLNSDKKFFIYVGYSISNYSSVSKYCSYYNKEIGVSYEDRKYYTIISAGEIPKPLVWINYGLYRPYPYDEITCYFFTSINNDVENYQINWQQYCNWLENNSVSSYSIKIELFQLINEVDACISGCYSSNYIQVYREINLSELNHNESLRIRVYEEKIPFICDK
jgi:hypothetical protein